MNAGSIVIHDYGDLEASKRSGLFLVIYSEADDDSIICNGNLLGLKVTSNPRDNHYDIKLSKDSNPFLLHDSYVMCSKPHVLTKNDSIVLGRIAPMDFIKVYAMYQKFHHQIEEQTVDVLLPILKEVKDNER